MDNPVTNLQITKLFKDLLRTKERDSAGPCPELRGKWI